jgi:hypothetical protein
LIDLSIIDGVISFERPRLRSGHTIVFLLAETRCKPPTRILGDYSQKARQRWSGGSAVSARWHSSMIVDDRVAKKRYWGRVLFFASRYIRHQRCHVAGTMNSWRQTPDALSYRTHTVAASRSVGPVRTTSVFGDRSSGFFPSTGPVDADGLRHSLSGGSAAKRSLARIIHDSSSRNRQAALRERRAEPGGPEAYSCSTSRDRGASPSPEGLSQQRIGDCSRRAHE